MAREVAELLREALELPVEARATLADSLLESLDDQHDLDAEERWREEIALRLKDVDSGPSELIGWQEAKVQLRRRLDE